MSRSWLTRIGILLLLVLIAACSQESLEPPSSPEAATPSTLSTAFVEGFNTTPGLPGSAYSFSQNGVAFTVLFTADGDGPDPTGGIAFDSDDGVGNSSSIDLLSGLLPGSATPERVTITRDDGATFVFSSLFVNNEDAPLSDGIDQTVTVAGYRQGILIGTAQTVNEGAIATLTFGDIVVDEVRLTSNDFFFPNLDNFSGNTDTNSSAIWFYTTTDGTNTITGQLTTTGTSGAENVVGSQLIVVSIDTAFLNGNSVTWKGGIAPPFSGGSQPDQILVTSAGNAVVDLATGNSVQALETSSDASIINIISLARPGTGAESGLAGPTSGDVFFIPTSTTFTTSQNSAPTITSDSTASVAENQTSAIDVNATDNLDSEGNGLVYSKSGGADAALFNIDAGSGVVTFINAPDFEAPTDDGTDNVYNLQVTVTDSGGLTAAQDITITVTDINDIPVITSPDAVSVPENQTAVLDVVAKDDDVSGTFAFRVTGGPDVALFEFVGVGNELVFKSAPDFENPLDQGADNVYTIEIEVDDNLGGVATQAITVTVTDEDETPADTTAPTSTPSFDPAANAANWHNSDVTVTFNWTDNEGGSGIDPDNCNLSTVVSDEGTSVGYGGGCRDLAGNVGETVGFLNIDKTAPETTLTSTPPATGTSSDVTFEFTGSDALSGVGSFECTLDDGVMGQTAPCTSPQTYAGLLPGTYTFSVATTDVAGNVDASPASYSFTIEDEPTATLLTSCGGHDVFETSPGVYDAPSFSGTLIVGTNGKDVLTGTSGPDLIVGLDMADDISGRAGADIICGGRGSDILMGGKGADILYGNGGADILKGNRGQDTLFGGSGRDALEGGQGNDNLFGNGGNDALDGGPDRDDCNGGGGTDTAQRCEVVAGVP